jgi:hypothetical protein
VFVNKLVSCESTKAGVPRGLESGVGSGSVCCFSISVCMSTSLHVSRSLKRRHDYELIIDDSIEPFLIGTSHLFRERWCETEQSTLRELTYWF